MVSDPIGNTPIFIEKTKNLSFKSTIWLTSRVMIYSFTMLAVFAVAGNWILLFLHIDMSAIHITGGIILFIMALEMLLDIKIGGVNTMSDLKTKQDYEHIAMVPLSFPLVAGPGTIVVVLTYFREASNSLGNVISVCAATVAILLLTFGVFVASKLIVRVFGMNIIDFFTKVIALLLAAIAVSMIGTGIYAFIDLLNG